MYIYFPYTPSQNKRRRVVYYADPLIGLPIISVALLVCSLVTVFKNQGRIIRNQKEITKEYKQLVDANNFRERRITDNQNMLDNHNHIDKFYPVTNLDSHTQQANERIRMILKSHLRLEGTGAVRVPNSDIFNRDYRLKLPYFLKHIRMQRKDPAFKQLRDIRFRGPKLDF